MEEILQHLGCWKTLVNNGINWINYQLQLVSLPDFRTINSNFEWFARETSIKRFFGLVSHQISPVAGRYESNPSPFKQLQKTRWHHRSLAEAGDPASFWNGTFSGWNLLKFWGVDTEAKHVGCIPVAQSASLKRKSLVLDCFRTTKRGMCTILKYSLV